MKIYEIITIKCVKSDNKVNLPKWVGIRGQIKALILTLYCTHGVQIPSGQTFKKIP